ncbi:hypothetical protein QTL86_16405 [Cellulosilyticum sp. ST5]|uniref:hypothetical protein n=1 Tax=Cellulosilyticum sp. ST5 TaxID=3055805 RepID=UPI003977AC03
MDNQVSRRCILIAQITGVIYIIASILMYKTGIWLAQFEGLIIPVDVPLPTNIKVNIFLLASILFYSLNFKEVSKKKVTRTTSMGIMIIVIGVIFIFNQSIAHPLSVMDRSNNLLAYGEAWLDLFKLNQLADRLQIFSLISFTSYIIGLSIWYGSHQSIED